MDKPPPRPTGPTERGLGRGPGNHASMPAQRAALSPDAFVVRLAELVAALQDRALSAGPGGGRAA